MGQLYRHGIALLCVGVLLLTGAIHSLASTPTTASAFAAAPTPTRPTPPPLPTSPSPTVPPPPTVPASSTMTDGAAIWLRVQCSARQPDDSHLQDLWTVVQWQDAAGNWHDVEGWRGPLDEVAKGEGRKVWWLPETLFGAGPFRWLVYTEPGGVLLATSSAFYLPQLAGQVEVIVVVLTF